MRCECVTRCESVTSVSVWRDVRVWRVWVCDEMWECDECVTKLTITFDRLHIRDTLRCQLGSNLLIKQLRDLQVESLSAECSHSRHGNRPTLDISKAQKCKQTETRRDWSLAETRQERRLAGTLNQGFPWEAGDRAHSPPHTPDLLEASNLSFAQNYGYSAWWLTVEWIIPLYLCYFSLYLCACMLCDQ